MARASSARMIIRKKNLSKVACLHARTADNSAVLTIIYKKTKDRHESCPCFFGGDKRIRTAGLLVANEALYQLSHIPKSELYYILFIFFCQQFFCGFCNFF